MQKAEYQYVLSNLVVFNNVWGVLFLRFSVGLINVDFPVDLQLNVCILEISISINTPICTYAFRIGPEIDFQQTSLYLVTVS
jgi:hypothetical protein